MRLRDFAAPALLGLLAACSNNMPPPNTAAPDALSGPGMQPYPVQFNCPANGTIVYTNAGQHRYYGADPVDAEMCVMERPEDTGRQWRLYSLFTPNAYNSDQLRGVLRRLFPLEAGKVVREPIRQPGGEFILTFTVVGLQSTTVRAGTFTTWVVDIRQEGVGFGNDFAATRRVWFDQNSWVAVKGTFQVLRELQRVNTVPNFEAVRIVAPAAP